MMNLTVAEMLGVHVRATWVVVRLLWLILRDPVRGLHRQRALRRRAATLRRRVEAARAARGAVH